MLVQDQWVSVRENLQKTLVFRSKYGVSCRFSLVQTDDVATLAPQIGDRILMLKDPWLPWILTGKKTMEIRGAL